MTYLYHLRKYAGKLSRLTCPACERPHCFTPYVDEVGQILHLAVGRCDHEASCGYHKTPADYFREHPETRQHDWRIARPASLDRASQPITQNLCIIPDDIVRRSVRLDYDSALVTFLRTLFPPETTARLIIDYRLGVTRDRAAIFFQLDLQGRCRGGKIIRYDPATGHRIKDTAGGIPVDWIHPRLKARGILPKNWTLSQCLFGEHLLKQRPQDTVILVEAEKTAVIGSGFAPEYIWIATGGRSGLNARIDILEGRRILVFPDVDAYDYWKQKLATHTNLRYVLSDCLQLAAGTDHPSADIADWLVAFARSPCYSEFAQGAVSPAMLTSKTPIHPIQSILDNPEVAALIADFDLQLVSITRSKTNEV